jgi:glycosyltransferase involved in cell wall biosynthesis
MRKKVIVIAWEFSRRGGIEEVSRQVADFVRTNRALKLQIWRYPKSNKLGSLARWWLRATLDKNAIYFFMHPYIFERFKDIWSRTDAPPAIVWAHGIEVWGQFGKKHASALPLATKIVASSAYTKERVLESFPQADISVAPLAVHCKPAYHFRPAQQPFEILTVGRLAGKERYKGHDLVLEALALLKQGGIGVHYNIVGSGDDSGRLKRRACELGVDDLVQFHGYLADDAAAKIYARSSVFVMPSHVIKRDAELWSGEGLGLVYLEAAGHGLPVIACEEGGQRDCVVDGETGFLVPPDPEAIAGKIVFLMKDKELCRRMGEAGRRLVSRRFTPGKFNESVLSVVNSTISAKLT